MSSKHYAEQQIHDCWMAIENVVKNILCGKTISKPDWQDAFGKIFKVVLFNNEYGRTKLKTYLAIEMREHVVAAKEQLLPETDETIFLKAYLKQWKKFIYCLECITVLFKDLDVHLYGISPGALRMSVELVLLETWLEEIYNPMRDIVLDNAIRLINLERGGMVIDSNQVLGVKESCMRLVGTTSELEEAYIAGIKNYYPHLIAQYIQQHGVRNYMAYAVAQIEVEEKNATRYLDNRSIVNVKKTTAEVFVLNYLDQLLSEMPILMREKNIEHMRLCYILVQKSPDGVQPILPIFEKGLQSIGLEFIRDNAAVMVKDATKYVQGLLDLYHQFSHLVSEIFANNPILLVSRDKAFQKVVNNTDLFTIEIPGIRETVTKSLESRCPELLASYCNLLLRQDSTRRFSMEEIEASISDVLLVLKYVDSKDLFLRSYKTHLTRRLLLKQSMDLETEERTITRLRDVGMAADVVNKMYQMIKDIKLSHDLTESFKTKVTGKVDQAGVKPEVFTMMILTPGFWRVQSEHKSIISLPTELDDILGHMEDFYGEIHKGRSLSWQHHVSHGVVAYTSSQGSFRFTMTTNQLVVLYAWNRRFDAVLRMEGLLTATGLSEMEIKRNLCNMCARPKMKSQLILCSSKVTNPNDITPETEFKLNLDFCGGKKRQINFITRLPLVPDSSDDVVTEAVVTLRKLRVQEGIIKLMKTRKQMTHDEIYPALVPLVVNYFAPSRKFVKEVVEWLIENNYIDRLDTDKNTYTYRT